MATVRSATATGLACVSEAYLSMAENGKRRLDSYSRTVVPRSSASEAAPVLGVPE